MSVGFDQWGRRRLGCGQRRKASRHDHRLSVTPAATATDTVPTTSAAAAAATSGPLAHPAASGPPGSPLPSGPRPASSAAPSCEPTPPASPRSRGGPSRASWRSWPRSSFPPSGQRATSPPRPVGGSGPVDRGRTVPVFEDADARVCPVLKHWRGPEHPGRCEKRWGRLRCPVGRTARARRRAAPLRSCQVGRPQRRAPSRATSKVRVVAASIIIPLRLAAPSPAPRLHPRRTRRRWPGRSRSGGAPP